MINRTKTVDVIIQSHSSEYIKPIAALMTVLESIYRNNFVKIAEKNCIYYEETYLPFKNLAQNVFAKFMSSKEIVGHTFSLFDKITSNTSFSLKPNNTNRLFIGCFILANNYYKKEIKLENVLNLNNEELKLLEKQTYELLGEDIYIEKKLIDEYIQFLYQ